MGAYLLALDQGTTSSRAILFDREQNILGVAQKEFTQFYPREGWVEHDPMEVWSSQYGVMMEVIAQSGVNPAEIAAIGIIVAVLNQLLIRSGREEQAMMTTLAGLIVVLMMIISQISVLFDTIKDLFAL